MSHRCWSAALLISYRPLFRQGDHQLYMVDSLHQWISSRLTCCPKKHQNHSTSICITDSSNSELLRLSDWWWVGCTGCCRSSQGPVRVWCQLKLSEYRLSLQEVVAGTGSRVGNGANSERLEQTERQWCLDRRFDSTQTVCCFRSTNISVAWTRACSRCWSWARYWTTWLNAPRPVCNGYNY